MDQNSHTLAATLTAAALLTTLPAPAGNLHTPASVPRATRRRQS